MASSINGNVTSSMYCQSCGASHPTQATQCFACGEPLSTVTGGSNTTTHPLTGLLLPGILVHQRYRILEALHTDEISTLYKAEDTQFGNSVVALKEIGQNQQYTQEASELIEASKREMLLLAGLIHPNLPRIYDYFVEHQHWYFVKDFLGGETLEAYLRKRQNRPLPAEEVLDSGIQLAAVLDYLHINQSPLGLKDLEMSAIWRTPDGKLYLSDTGTVPQSAPMSQSISVYSLGRILRQLQTGNMSLRTRLQEALPKWRRRPRHVESSPLKGLIRKMTHKDVRKRPSYLVMVKQELQQQELQLLTDPANNALASSASPQTSPSSPPKRHLLSRRTLLNIGTFGIAAIVGPVAWFAESTVFGMPHPGYSPDLGGTICTYNIGKAVLGVAWSPNGMRLVMGTSNGQVQAWDANTGLHVSDFRASDLSERIEDVTWLPDGKSIAAGGDDAIVWIWNTATGQLQRTYRGHTDWVITLASSPNGKYIASGSYDRTVQVWEVSSGQQNVIYREHSDKVCSVTWSPDGRYIASASYDMTVQVWEAATGRPIFTYGGHAGAVYTVAWSPDGQHIASGDASGTIHIWPIALFEDKGQQQPSVVTYEQIGHNTQGNSDYQNNPVEAVVWSPDNIYVASISHDAQIHNSLTGEHIFTYTKHASLSSETVQSIAWSPNGRYIATGGIEGTVQVWNAFL
jgi:Tol biopolymer transport system component